MRVIAATNRDLLREVREGRFREDLYYRLNVLQLKTIPLKERRADIDVLVENQLEKLVFEHGLDQKRFSPQAMAVLRSYDWPGNVRELENAVGRAVVAAKGTVIGPELLCRTLQIQNSEPHVLIPENRVEPADLESSASVSPTECVEAAKEGSDLTGGDEHRWLKMADLERHHLQQTLRFTGFNQSAAARLLGLTLRVLRRKIWQYELDPRASDTVPSRQT